jgi:hypothetical protein
MGAYILISGRPGRVRDGVNAVTQMEGVPDVFVYVETSDDRKPNQLLIDKIQKLEGMERTKTHIAVE